MTTNFKRFQQNLHDFYHGLPQTDVFILYFHAYELTKPLIRDRFRQWTVGDDGTPVYLMRGRPADKTGLFNYLYIYTPTSVKLISTPLSAIPDPYDPNEGIIYSVIVDGVVEEPETMKIPTMRAPEDIINSYLGDHIDFAIIAHRNPLGTLVKTHSTSYTLNDDTMQFYRTQNDCNFVIPDAVMKAPALKSVVCENTKVQGRIVADFYKDVLDQHVLQGLLDRLFKPKLRSGSGGAVMAQRFTYDHRGGRHRIHIGKRGGLYWLSADGRRRYMVKRGGQGPPITVADVEGALDDVIPMLAELLFEPVNRVRPMELVGVRVFFDTGNEWGVGMNQWLVVMYDFDHSTHVSYVNMDTVMKARHAYRRPVVVSMIMDEAQQCLNDLRMRAAEVLARMVSVQ